MFKKGIKGFAYYLGIDSLADMATKRDRVCVLNILGGESRQGNRPQTKSATTHCYTTSIQRTFRA
jgi:hypothetical protein